VFWSTIALSYRQNGLSSPARDECVERAIPPQLRQPTLSELWRTQTRTVDR
jgi:hypothetical protein